MKSGHQEYEDLVIVGNSRDIQWFGCQVINPRIVMCEDGIVELNYNDGKLSHTELSHPIFENHKRIVMPGDLIGRGPEGQDGSHLQKDLLHPRP